MTGFTTYDDLEKALFQGVFEGRDCLKDSDSCELDAFDDCQTHPPRRLQAEDLKRSIFSFKGSHVIGVEVHDAIISGDLDLSHGQVDFPIRFIRCHFQGSILARFAAINFLELYKSACASVVLNRATIQTSVHMSECTITCGVAAFGCRIDGRFDLTKSFLGVPYVSLDLGAGTPPSPSPESQYVHNFRAGESVPNYYDKAPQWHSTHHDSSSLAVPASFISDRKEDSRVPKPEVENDPFLTKPDYALRLDNAVIRADLVLRNAWLRGGVTACGLTADSIDMDGLTANCNAHVLLFQEVEVTRTIFLRGATVTGETDFSGAKVGGQVLLSGSKCKSNDNCALRLSSSDITGRLDLSMDESNGPILLDGAHIGLLVTPDDKAELPKPLYAQGWQIADMTGSIECDFSAVQSWLMSSDSIKKNDSLSPRAAQPWQVLADVMEKKGYWNVAQRLRFTGVRWERRDPFKRENLSKIEWIRYWVSRGLSGVYGFLVGYGYRPLRAAIWLFAIFIASLILTSVTPASFVPTDNTIAIQAVAQHQGIEINDVPRIDGSMDCSEFGDDYPCFSRMSYSLEVAIPAAALGSSSAWTPNSSLVNVTLIVLKGASWLLTLLLVAGVTGLLRKA